MWPDNETATDFINFRGVADTVGQIIVKANGRPISIGVSGAWGSGKSSMIRLVHEALKSKQPEPDQRQFVFVEFNAWLYQGYDDARAALTEVIATKLATEAEARKRGVDKVRDLLGRVNWLRAAKLTAGSGLALALGLPPIGVFGEAWKFGTAVLEGGVDSEAIAKGEEIGEKVGGIFGGLIKDKPGASAPKEIAALRQSFVEALEAMNVTLVVLIDDLDRCLPPTTISTLEAIRLFLFLPHTAFVVAADTDMIKHAVRHHFGGVDESIVTNYFDKLIQVPIRVPPLGTQEVRAYMMMLFVENSTVPVSEHEPIRAAVCRQLSQSWQGKRVDRAFMQSLGKTLPADLVSKLDTAERLAPLMTSASGIVGNPRLVKRFLNALAIRMTISETQGVGVDEAALAKMLLFERLGSAAAFAQLTSSVNADEKGKPTILKQWEEDAAKGALTKLPVPWDDPFVLEWLALPPRLADIDLRGILYVSREHAPVITPEDRLSSNAADLLTGLLEHPDMAASLKDRLARLPRNETTIIMDRLLEKARQEQVWGAPSILEACLTVSEADPVQGPRLSAFLQDRPLAQIQASIVPKIGDQPWAKAVFDKWETLDVSRPVKAAIKARKV
jgi:predicted KAP-like P-loop ATPase